MKFNVKTEYPIFKDKFAFFPVKLYASDVVVWLERYIEENDSHYLKAHEYTGCAERVGYPCDCVRH